MATHERVDWPYSDEYIPLIECYLVKAPRAKLYVWFDKSELTADKRHFTPSKGWNYTLSAGAISDRSHTGFVGECANVDEAVNKAIKACKKARVWNG